MVSAIFSVPAAASQVTGLSALSHDGQTFVTWDGPTGLGWTYRVYASNSAMLDSSALTPARLIATVGDSSWCDRRLSSLSGITLGFVVDSLAPPLTPGQGLFVETPVASGTRWYAVTAQAKGSGQDRTITLGGNSLAEPVTEIVARPRPVFQRTMQVGSCAGAIYTLWTTNRATPLFPAMSNRPGKAFGISVSLGTPDFQHALMILPHHYGGGFYPPACVGPGDYVLKLDDLVARQDAHDFWFGYSDQYDPDSLNNVPPVSGVVEDYTDRRVVFSLEWARRTFPVDTTRVYAAGGSMGGIGSVFLAMWHPELIAAAWANVPLVDFSSESDPNPVAGFNRGNHFRLGCDRFWGEVGTDLRMVDGTRVFERLNAGAVAASLEAKFVPPIFTFNGRNDTTVGWADKIPFYNAMQNSRAGGTFYWDRRDHYTAIASAWTPMMDYGVPYIYRFRTNLSFPAFSNCSADGNPGNGTAADGDSIGTINGFLDWDPAVIDEPLRWIVTLTTRDPRSTWGPIVAPDSMTVNVTPRRLQKFIVTQEDAYPYVVKRMSDGKVVKTGLAFADELGVLTIPNVKVYKGGSRLTVILPLPADVDPELAAAGPRPRIAPVPSPARSGCPLAITWTRGGNASVDLLDLAGRRMKAVWRGEAAAGPQRLQLDLAGVPSGVYMIVAREGEAMASRRIVVVH